MINRLFAPNPRGMARRHGDRDSTAGALVRVDGLRRQRRDRRPSACRDGEWLERVAGIEPAYSAWKAAALPLSYTRGGCRYDPVTEWWRELDLNQRRLSQRIYSPSPLTTRASLQYSVWIVRPSSSDRFALPPLGLRRVYDGPMSVCQHDFFVKTVKKYLMPDRLPPPRATRPQPLPIL
jgi:hypothetical protein